MKKLLGSLLVLPFLVGIAAADFTGTGAGATFVDNDTVSSTISATGTTGNITDISVTISGLEHTWAGDLNATLSNGTDTADVFVRADDGSAFGPNVDLSGDFTFNAGGALDWTTEVINAAGAGALDGSVGTFFADFSVFNGQAKDGDWTLAITDSAGGDSGQFASWSISITSDGGVIPEPTTATILALAGLGLVSRRRR